MNALFFRTVFKTCAVVIAALTLASCSTTGTAPSQPRKETLHVITQSLQLLTINAGQPEKVLQRVGLSGLPAGDQLVGMDYRVNKGVLFALSRSGRVYTINTDSGVLTPLGLAPIASALEGSVFGFDFNPAADRIRVVSNTGQNLRLHPDTGALVATDAPLAYEPGDTQAGNKPNLAAAAYTYNKTNEKLTTNYAVDLRAGMLVRQGSLEGEQPVVSPNTGRLFTVGPLGTGALSDATMDIADTTGVAFAALQTTPRGAVKLYTIALESGKAQLLGTITAGEGLVGIAVIP
jgi:hypothetical protein